MRRRGCDSTTLINPLFFLINMQIIKIPFSGGNLGKNPGTEKAPDAIVKTLKEMYLTENFTKPVFEVKEIKVNNANAEESHTEIYTQAITSLTRKTVFLGGDHSIGYPLFKAIEKVNSNTGFIIFDAHPDLMQSFTPATHENYLRNLVEENIIKPENIILIGVRSMDSEEIQFLKQKKITTYFMKNIAEHGFKEICFSVMEKARNFSNIHISIDIDALDSAFAPGTGYPEPGGLSTRELLFFIHKLKLLKHISSWDVVEVNPDKDLNNLTVKTAAKLVNEISG